MTPLKVYIGWDPREIAAYDICRWSLMRRCSQPIHVKPIMLSSLRQADLYKRKHSERDGRLWDEISEAPMSTEFAISRFFIPYMNGGGWALFMDCDMLVLGDVAELFALAEPDKAVMVVKHVHVPDEEIKMDDQIQTRYARKNWSSVVLWNLDHPAHASLTLDDLNALPGRDLHRFCWLKDEEIGELPLDWNYLDGVSQKILSPKLVHYTLGTPDMKGYEEGRWQEVWHQEVACMKSQNGMTPVAEAAE